MVSGFVPRCSLNSRSDTQVVTGKDAESCNGLVEKQMKSVGVPLRHEVVNELRKELLKLNSAPLEGIVRHCLWGRGRLQSTVFKPSVNFSSLALGNPGILPYRGVMCSCTWMSRIRARTSPAESAA